MIFETNYWGPYELMRLVLPSMRKRGSGRIVNVTSGGGVIAPPLFGAYVATKHALDGISAAMDLELEPLGGYRTEIGEKFPTEYLETTSYPYNLRARFDAANASFNEREDLTPVVDAVIEAATAGEPAIRYPVPGENPNIAEIINALGGSHLSMRRLTASRGLDE